MSDAVFYYYPDSGGTLETVTITADAGGVTVVQDGLAVQRAESRSASGVHFNVLLSAARPVRLEFNHVSGLNHEATRRALRNLVAHLKRGGRCGFAADASKAWGSFARSTYIAQRGQTTYYCRRQAWYSTTATLADNDPIVIEEGWPGYVEEETLTAGSVANSANTVSTDALLTTFTGLSHVRHRDFFPVLSMSADAAAQAYTLLANERPIVYKIVLELVYDVESVMGLAGAGPVVRQVGASKQTGSSIEQGIAALANARGFGGSNG